MILLLCLFSLFASQGKKIDFYIKYTVIVNNIPEKTQKVQIWIPYPKSDIYQKIHTIKIHAHYPTYILKEGKYGNEFVYLEIENPEYDYIDVSLDIFASRYERREKIDFKKVREPNENLLLRFKDYFINNRDETANYGKLRRIIRRILKDKKTYIGKVKALYNYVYNNMEYSKDIPGYGTGDIERACRIKAGNCIDFHSLFIALSNVSNIISREVAYIDIPLEKSKIPNYCEASYHCAVEVYLPGINKWFPLDISHAKKGKGSKEFYFGSLDNLRLRLGHGRNVKLPRSDIRLKRVQVKPFVLVNGKIHADIHAYVIANILSDTKRIYNEIINKGEKARIFKGKTIDGRDFFLKDYIGKKNILLNFFTTWCGRCQWESEGLEKVYFKYKDKFIFVRVNVMEEKEKIEEFLKKYKHSFPIIYDPKAEIAKLYGIKYVPANIIIGLDGKVKWVGGLLPKRDLKERVKEFLK